MMSFLKWPRLSCRGAAVVVCMLVSVGLAAGQQARTPPEIAPEAGVARREMMRAAHRQRARGSITASRDGGATWLPLGTVLKPARAVNGAGYTASKWANDSAVAAIATNGIHIKITSDRVTGRGIVFSLCPGGKAYGEAEVESDTGLSFSRTSPAGIASSAGHRAPGERSGRGRASGKTAPLPPGYVPAAGDVICIARTTPAKLPSSLTFQNKFGGLVTVEYPGRSRGRSRWCCTRCLAWGGSRAGLRVAGADPGEPLRGD